MSAAPDRSTPGGRRSSRPCARPSGPGEELSGSCADPALLVQLDEVAERLKVATRRRYELRKEIGGLRAWIESDQHELAGDVFPSRADQLHERIEERRVRANVLDRELADVVQEMAHLEQREQDIRERMLEP